MYMYNAFIEILMKNNILVKEMVCCVTHMCRYSVYYDEVKGQLLETDKDKLEGTSLSHPSSGM